MGAAGALSEPSVCGWRSSAGHRRDEQAGDANQTPGELQHDVRSPDGGAAGFLQETLPGGISQEVVEGEWSRPVSVCACVRWR